MDSGLIVIYCGRCSPAISLLAKIVSGSICASKQGFLVLFVAVTKLLALVTGGGFDFQQGQIFV